MFKEIEKIVKAHRAFTKERNWDQLQNPKNLSMALAVEASEQIADVFLYLLRISDTLGIDLLKATYEKMEKNKEKYSIAKSLALAQALVETIS